MFRLVAAIGLGLIAGALPLVLSPEAPAAWETADSGVAVIAAAAVALAGRVGFLRMLLVAAAALAGEGARELCLDLGVLAAMETPLEAGLDHVGIQAITPAAAAAWVTTAAGFLFALAALHYQLGGLWERGQESSLVIAVDVAAGGAILATLTYVLIGSVGDTSATPFFRFLSPLEDALDVVSMVALPFSPDAG